MNAPVGRRALLGALAVAPIATLPAVTMAVTVDTTCWDRAVAAYEAAKARADHFHRMQLAPLEPHVPRSKAYDPYQVGTDKSGSPVMCSFTRAELLNEDSLYVRTKGWQQARAEMIAYDTAYAAFDDRTGYSRINDECDRLDIAASDALRALLLTPAPHTAALCRKLMLLTDAEGEFLYDTGPFILAIRADAARFAS